MIYIRMTDVRLSYDRISDLVTVSGIKEDGTHVKYRCRHIIAHGAEMCIYLTGIWLKNPVDIPGDHTTDMVGVTCDEVHYDSREVPRNKLEIDEYHLGQWGDIDGDVTKLLVDDYLAEPPFKTGRVYTTPVYDDKGEAVGVEKWKVLSSVRIDGKWYYSLRCESGPLRNKYGIAQQSRWFEDGDLITLCVDGKHHADLTVDCEVEE